MHLRRRVEAIGFSDVLPEHEDVIRPALYQVRPDSGVQAQFRTRLRPVNAFEFVPHAKGVERYNVRRLDTVIHERDRV